ncbi:MULTISPECIES: DUF268 domain-containing protein [unclassified Spirosoma]|uniref:DUF268 domain-containing protein n=1 Tax=unclassified Spirosoma TaxID=2621999 RepID=UPI00096346AA|nr:MULTISPECIES: DUF268 domain-containing protein [unclassified Spirosoma]MBN8824529.1 DUF268 domain-containing protein [Spirosoma sp.]OJW70896.1 MAG: hypothetical protein BGO59_32235 [Spirosoma sp. 48-14]
MIGRILKLGTQIVWGGVKATPAYVKDYFTLKKQLNGNPDFPIRSYYPAIFDRYDESGIFVKHYFLQDLYVAQRIFKNNPVKHVDIGSRIDGFVAHVASYRPIEIIDIRPLNRSIPNVRFRQADLMNLPADMIQSTDSISALHAIEHFGLGRYGDPIDVNGHLKALDNIRQIIKPGGRFYFSSPIGPQGIVYNAHRVFSVAYLLNLFEPYYTVERFSYIDDNEQLVENANLRSEAALTNFGCTYGCGIFEMTRRAD